MMLADLHRVNETWLRAWFEKDAATVERLMAEDYVYVAPSGQVLDRAAILGIIRSPSYRLHHGNRAEVVVRPLGTEAAVIRHRWQGEGTFEGTAFKDDHRCVMVCARQGGEWQVVFEQCTANSG
jgi:ketosteroid isomerase-like protein